ncbi:MAG TPA: hypothetical protein VF487_07920 [Chitinophagaceae bacterium]
MKVCLSFCFSSILLLLQGCTTYYLKNNSTREQRIKISYEKCINPAERRSALNRYEKNGKITNVIQTTNDSTCLFEFTIQSQTVLPLGSIINLYDENKIPGEGCILCISKYVKDTPSVSCDTILNRAGKKTIANKFKLYSRVLSWTGHSTYIFRIEN